MRGPAGQPVDAARQEGFHEAIAKSGRKVDVVEVVGNWAPGDAQKVTADAIAAGGMFDGIYVQGGSQGAATAMLDAGKFIVPMSGETENGFRMMCNAIRQGLALLSRVAPALPSPSVTIKTAIAALKGEKIPQSIALPTSISYAPLQGGRRGLPGPSGQLLRRQQLRSLQDRLHRRGDCGADRGKQLELS